jgi:hypothetical protein
MLSYIKDKKASTNETAAASAANAYMWEQLHQGNYDSIPAVLAKLHAAYEADPNDAQVTAHLGFVYLWTFSERIRSSSSDRMLENILLSNRFFKEAILLNPEDARLYGFQSAVQMCEGALTNNLEMLATAYFGGLKSIRKWPQFNMFALGYVEGQLDSNSVMYRQGLRYQWRIIDKCSPRKITRENILENPEEELQKLYAEINQSEDPEIKRACGNSWIAPHNWEGFFMNLGDMLVKAGDTAAAKQMYQAIKISPAYPEWIYQDEVDKRINNMKSNVEAFNRKQNLIHLSRQEQMMINSSFSCTGCHSMSRTEFAKAGTHIPEMQQQITADEQRRTEKK